MAYVVGQHTSNYRCISNWLVFLLLSSVGTVVVFCLSAFVASWCGVWPSDRGICGFMVWCLTQWSRCLLPHGVVSDPVIAVFVASWCGVWPSDPGICGFMVWCLTQWSQHFWLHGVVSDQVIVVFVTSLCDVGPSDCGVCCLMVWCRTQWLRCLLPHGVVSDPVIAVWPSDCGVGLHSPVFCFLVDEPCGIHIKTVGMPEGDVCRHRYCREYRSTAGGEGGGGNDFRVWFCVLIVEDTVVTVGCITAIEAPLFYCIWCKVW
jgi:hypothetical protein